MNRPWLVLVFGSVGLYLLYTRTKVFQVALPDGQKLINDLFTALKTDPLAGIPPSADGNQVVTPPPPPTGTDPSTGAASSVSPQVNNPSSPDPPPVTAP